MFLKARLCRRGLAKSRYIAALFPINESLSLVPRLVRERWEAERLAAVAAGIKQTETVHKEVGKEGGVPEKRAADGNRARNFSIKLYRCGE